MGDQQQPQPTPLAEKWDRFYTAEGSAPFDSHLPSSQLVDYLCTCLPAEQDKRHIAVTALDDSAIADLASQAPMCLPPQAEGAHTQQVLHVCEQCAAHKPPKGEMHRSPALCDNTHLNAHEGHLTKHSTYSTVLQ